VVSASGITDRRRPVLLNMEDVDALLLAIQIMHVKPHNLITVILQKIKILNITK